MNQAVTRTLQDRWQSFRISWPVRGYSGAIHYAVFRTVLETRKPKKILVLGVYFGRDICFLLNASKRLQMPVSITGVDKFSDDACEDWPNESRTLKWSEAGFGPAPSFEAAQSNVSKFGTANIIQKKDDDYLASCGEKFDAIYIDTSHDYGTVCRQIKQASRLLNPNGVLFGDDYSDQGTWGVKKAVTELLPQHDVFNNWIWLSDKTRHLT